MKNLLPLQCTKLVRKRLLDTECRAKVSAKGEVPVELTHNVEFVPQDRAKGATYDFYVDTTTCLVGKSKGTEVLKISFTIRADYKIIAEGVSIDYLNENRIEFGQQLFLSAREHMSYLLNQMGFNPSFLPYSMESGEIVQQNEEEVEKLKAEGKTKRKAGQKKK